MTDHYHIIKDWTDQVASLPFVHLSTTPLNSIHYVCTLLIIHRILSNKRADIDFNLNAILWNPLMDTTSIQNNINQ